MRYAISNRERVEASPDASGICSACEAPLIPKCGHSRVWHWAHKGTSNCDRWWEPETEWHRRWKDEFPKDWQEVVQVGEDGERHIADIRTSVGIVIEFQHSPIKRDEQLSREAFYRNMVWVVDGKQKGKDLLKAGRLPMSKGISEGLAAVIYNPRTAFPESWVYSRVPVIFDHGFTYYNRDYGWQQYLTCLLPGKFGNASLYFRIGKDTFISRMKTRESFLDWPTLQDEIDRYKRADHYAITNAIIRCLD